MKKLLVGLGLLGTLVISAVSFPLETNAAGKEFDVDEDRMLDDFKHEVLEDTSQFSLVDATGNYDYNSASYLDVNINNNNNTVNTAIYKAAPKLNTMGKTGVLSITLRSIDSSVSLADLDLHYRGASDKDSDTLAVNLAEARDQDNAALDEITASWTTIHISPMNSVEDQAYINGYVGLHLVAKPNLIGKLSIKEMWYAEQQGSPFNASSGVYPIDNFSGRETVSQTNSEYPNTWWRFSHTGVLASNGLTLNGGTYTVASDSRGNGDNAHSNIVLTLKGGEMDEIKFVYGDVTNGYTYSKPYAWNELKNNAGSTYPSITTQEFYGYIINFDATGIESNIAGIMLTGTGVTIKSIFFTSEAPLIPATEFPRMNADSRRVFEDFNRDIVGATTTYIPNTPTATAGDLYYILSYSGSESLAMEDNALVFDGTKSPGTTINYKSSGSRNNNGTYPFVVFKMKGTDGASLKNFSFTTIDDSGNTTEPKLFNELYSDVQYNIPDFDAIDYPYTTSDGWMYIIINLEYSGFPAGCHGFDFYYSGPGKLYIDETLYMTRATAAVEYTDVVSSLETQSDVTLPEIEYSLVDQLTIGETVVINPTFTDDMTSSEEITTVIKVKHNGEYIDLTSENSFVVEQGSYIIIIIAIDNNNNTNILKLYREVA